jgi:hypothetical protein
MMCFVPNCVCVLVNIVNRLITARGDKAIAAGRLLRLVAS